MTVSPGSVDIERGDSQRILATLRAEPDRDVLLVFQQGDGEWDREAMQRGSGEPAFQREFFNVQESIEVCFEVGDVRSEPFKISMYNFLPSTGLISHIGIPPIRGCGSASKKTVETSSA